MKRIKLNFGLAAMVLGLSATFAFKAPVKAKHFDNPFWHYVSGDPTQSSSYTRDSGTPDCPGSTNMCAIEAPASTSNPNQPAISSQLAQRIESKDTSQGDVLLKD